MEMGAIKCFDLWSFLEWGRTSSHILFNFRRIILLHYATKSFLQLVLWSLLFLHKRQINLHKAELICNAYYCLSLYLPVEGLPGRLNIYAKRRRRVHDLLDEENPWMTFKFIIIFQSRSVENAKSWRSVSRKINSANEIMVRNGIYFTIYVPQLTPDKFSPRALWSCSNHGESHKSRYGAGKGSANGNDQVQCERSGHLQEDARPQWSPQQ